MLTERNENHENGLMEIIKDGKMLYIDEFQKEYPEDYKEFIDAMIHGWDEETKKVKDEL